jgi:hypothetical protein
LAHLQATFYGAGGSGDKGACMHSPGFNGVGITVAMNVEQYEEGSACGKCIVARGTGSGAGVTPVLGPVYATVCNIQAINNIQHQRNIEDK